MTVRIQRISLLALVALTIAHPGSAANRPDYTVGLRVVKRAIAGGDFKQAERSLEQLTARYRNNAELIAMLAKVQFWQKRYLESFETYCRALALKPDPDLERESLDVVTAMLLSEADHLLASQQADRAEILLRKLFDRNKARYDAGLRLARLYLAGGRHDRAADLLVLMVSEFPGEKDLLILYAQALLGMGDTARLLSLLATSPATGQEAELLAIRGRALFRLKRFSEAADSFKASLFLADDPAVRLELERSRTAEELERAERLITEGKNDAAVTLLTPIFDSGRNRYDAGVKLAGLQSRSGNFEEAARIYAALMQEYPDQPEFPFLYAKALINLNRPDEALHVLNGIKNGYDARLYALRGRIFFIRRQLGRARDEYARALRLTNVPDVIAEMNEVEAALRFEQAERLVAGGKYRLAEPMLRSMADAGAYPYESRLLIGRIHLAEREYERAAGHYRLLHEDYPSDYDLTALYVESLILAGRGCEGGDVLSSLDPQSRDLLKQEREDLFYRVNANWFKLSGGVFGYSNGSGDETGVAATLSQRYKGWTFVGTASETNRFGSTDPQFGLDIYVGKGERSKLWGMLSFSVSPDASFLPLTTFGGELSRGYGDFEFSAGYNRLNFKGNGVNIVTAGLLWYIPKTTLSLNEKVYAVPENGTATFVTTLHWEPDHRFRSFIAAGAGNSAEKITTAREAARYASYSVRAGAEYRFTPCYSIGAEGSFESRRGLYDRSGGTVYARYWWR